MPAASPALCAAEANDTTGSGGGGGGGTSSSAIVTVTELGLPAVTEDGSVPSATVKVSSSKSASSAVEIVPEPVTWLLRMRMLASEP